MSTVHLKRLAVAVAGVTLLLVGPATASVSDAPTLDDGTYTGRMTVSGSFGFDVNEGGATGSIRWTGDQRGTMTLTIEQGSATGEWSLSGPGSIDGQFSADGNTITIEGDQTTDAGGAVTGSGGDYQLTGSATTTSTVTLLLPVEVAGLSGQTVTTTDTVPVDASLTDLLFTCNQLVGRFDHEIKQQLEGIGFVENIQGTFSLVREPTTDETGERLDQLQEQISTAKAGLSEAQQLDSLALELSWIAGIRDAVVAAAEVAATLEGPSPCPAQQQQYVELAADLAREGLDALRAADAAGSSVPTSVLRRTTLAAVASGMTTTPEGQESLNGVRDVVQDRWLDLTSGDFSVGDPELVQLATFAAQMDWPLPTAAGGEISGRDVLIVLGEEG